MPLLNYTTSIDAAKTVSEIQYILAQHGAKAIMMTYDGQGGIDAITFSVLTPLGEMGFRLPINPIAVLKVMERDGKVPCRFKNKEQAVKVAWRILKDWIGAQMAIIETEMVKMEQVFLPYAVTPTGATLYEELSEKGFKALTAGKETA